MEYAVILLHVPISPIEKDKKDVPGVQLIATADESELGEFEKLVQEQQIVVP